MEQSSDGFPCLQDVSADHTRIGRQKRKESGDLLIEQIGRTGHARPTLGRHRADRDLFPALTAERCVSGTFFLEKCRVDAVARGEEFLRRLDYFRWIGGGDGFLEGSPLL